MVMWNLLILVCTVVNQNGTPFVTVQTISEEWNEKRVGKLGCKGSSCFWIVGASSPSTTGKQWKITYRDAWAECTDVLGGSRLAHLDTMELYSWFKERLSLRRLAQFQWIFKCYQVLPGVGSGRGVDRLPYPVSRFFTINPISFDYFSDSRLEYIC